MKLFTLNTFRMAKKNKGSFLGAVFVIAIGIFVFVAMIDTLQNLKGQVDSYYEKNALADIFAEVSGISSVQLQNENRTEFAMLYGLNKNSSMWRIMDIYRNVFEPPTGSVILNERIAKKLRVTRGDEI